jgi:tRNA(Arg) A34 adenosine deaminase TadA
MAEKEKKSVTDDLKTLQNRLEQEKYNYKKSRNEPAVDALVKNIRAQKMLAEWHNILLEDQERIVYQLRKYMSNTSKT